MGIKLIRPAAALLLAVTSMFPAPRVSADEIQPPEQAWRVYLPLGVMRAELRWFFIDPAAWVQWYPVTCANSIPCRPHAVVPEFADSFPAVGIVIAYDPYNAFIFHWQLYPAEQQLCAAWICSTWEPPNLRLWNTVGYPDLEVVLVDMRPAIISPVQTQKMIYIAQPPPAPIK